VTDTETPAPSLTNTPRPTRTSRPTDTPEPTATPTPDLERVRAEVVDVIDGDTIEVEIDGETYTVRYIGIDTPETVHPSEPIEWMGPEASEANRRLVEGETVYLEEDVSETDQYGRLLRYVFLEDGTMVNAALVEMGYAQASTYPPDVRYQDLLLEAEQEAREEEQGLWGPTPAPTPTPYQTLSPPTLTPTYTPSATAQPPTPTFAPTVPPPPTVTTAPTQAPAAPGDVQIAYIYYDGQVPRVESDEYALLQNVGGSPVNIGGWHLYAGDPGQDFWFPDYVLQPGQECRVYTNEVHPESGGFTFGSGQAIWNNGGDCGYLYDATGAEVSSHCY
jgi:micrococcal nuclease